MCLQGFALVLEAPGRQKAVFLVCGFDFGLQVFGFSIGLEKKIGQNTEDSDMLCLLLLTVWAQNWQEIWANAHETRESL